MKGDTRMTVAELRRAANLLRIWSIATRDAAADGLALEIVTAQRAEADEMLLLSRKLYAHARKEAAERKAAMDLCRQLRKQARSRPGSAAGGPVVATD
ncbi:MAG TPA: hypothetical protein VJQ42_02100 [Rhodanobacteraceae bacterium]|nr:hypothetical protein [Rhodanobacteraceae bacterium]